MSNLTTKTTGEIHAGDIVRVGKGKAHWLVVTAGAEIVLRTEKGSTKRLADAATLTRLCGAVYCESHPFTCTLPADGHTDHADDITDAPATVHWQTAPAAALHDAHVAEYAAAVAVENWATAVVGSPAFRAGLTAAVTRVPVAVGDTVRAPIFGKPTIARVAEILNDGRIRLAKFGAIVSEWERVTPDNAPAELADWELELLAAPATPSAAFTPDEFVSGDRVRFDIDTVSNTVSGRFVQVRAGDTGKFISNGGDTVANWVQLDKNGATVAALNDQISAHHHDAELAEIAPADDTEIPADYDPESTYRDAYQYMSTIAPSLVGHVDYPHQPGYLDTCDACVTGPCVCADDPSAAPCVSGECTASAILADERDSDAVPAPAGTPGAAEPRQTPSEPRSGAGWVKVTRPAPNRAQRRAAAKRARRGGGAAPTLTLGALVAATFGNL